MHPLNAFCKSKISHTTALMLFNELWKPVLSVLIITKIVKCVKTSGAKQLLWRNAALQSVIVNYKQTKQNKKKASQLHKFLSSYTLTPCLLCKQRNSADSINFHGIVKSFLRYMILEDVSPAYDITHQQPISQPRQAYPKNLKTTTIYSFSRGLEVSRG